MNITTKQLEAFEWKRYEPQAFGWNGDLAEKDRWYVKIRQHPSRKEASRARRILQQDSIESHELIVLVSMVKGPYNLRVNGKPVETLIDLFGIVDSEALSNELVAEALARIRLSEKEAADLSGPSGGGTKSPDGESPKDTGTETLARVALVSKTPEPPPARTSTTNGAANPERRASPSDPETTDRLASGKR